jgi:poly(3-hydroxybutyrate) depolymerase
MASLRHLCLRARVFFGRLFARKPPQPGRFESGSKSSARGFLGIAPWILPSRDYLVYIPSGHRRWHWRRAPMIVLLHGCKQTPEEIAAATRITQLADAEGCLVLLPRQKERANPYGCWNWFDVPTMRGWGETAIIAAQIRAVRRRYRVDQRRVFVAGISSGGGLAAVLGVRQPALIAGVFVHSGIACGAARSPFTAMGVLKDGANRDVVKIGTAARSRAGADALPVVLLAVQGKRDEAVAPVNAAQLVRQYLALNDHPAAAVGRATDLPPPDTSETTTLDGRIFTLSEWRRDARLLARHVLVDELGHAWSGGDAQFPFNDPAPPDATALLGALVRELDC